MLTLHLGHIPSVPIDSFIYIFQQFILVQHLAILILNTRLFTIGNTWEPTTLPIILLKDLPKIEGFSYLITFQHHSHSELTLRILIPQATFKYQEGIGWDVITLPHLRNFISEIFLHRTIMNLLVLLYFSSLLRHCPKVRGRYIN